MLICPALICPRCDRELGPEHDAKACERKFSRRFFFGVAFGGLAAAVAKAKPVPPWVALINAGINPDWDGSVLAYIGEDDVVSFNPQHNLFRLKDADYEAYHSREWLLHSWKSRFIVAR